MKSVKLQYKRMKIEKINERNNDINEIIRIGDSNVLKN